MKGLLDDKLIRVYVVVGLVGIMLVAISGLFDSDSSDNSSGQITVEYSSSQYQQQLTQELQDLLGNIEGVGEVYVMLTLESGQEYVYVMNQKQSSELSDSRTTDNIELSPVIIEGSDGTKTPLVKLVSEPKVKGVVIVCEGGNSVFVEQRVTSAVCVALGIGANSVHVSPLK